MWIINLQLTRSTANHNQFGFGFPTMIALRTFNFFFFYFHLSLSLSSSGEYYLNLTLQHLTKPCSTIPKTKKPNCLNMNLYFTGQYRTTDYNKYL